MEKKFYLRTYDQKVLFDCEIKGQISDGNWENARPSDHWIPWCDCVTYVDADKQGTNFWAQRTKYNLLDKGLLEIIAGRMILYVRLARVFGIEDVATLSHLFDDAGTWVGTAPNYPGEYWSDIRKRLDKFHPNDVKMAGEEPEYDMKALRADLKEIKLAMQARY